MKKILLILFSTSLVSCLSLSLKIDEEGAKSIADAINNSNKKELHVMKLNENDLGVMKDIDNIIITSNFDDIEWVGGNEKKIKKIMIKAEKLGKGPNASKYMSDLPEVIIQRIEKASEEGIDIKIDTIISNDGEKKEIKIEVKTGNN
tara:strand:- start:398 stop:838 length:441 start_codon:yes stop_codon:yes gene_type:complete